MWRGALLEKGDPGEAVRLATSGVTALQKALVCFDYGSANLALEMTL